MANTSSAKKCALQNEKCRIINTARRTAIKTAIKKVLVAIEQGLSEEKTTVLFRAAQAQLSRARGKGLIHANALARKTSRLNKKIAIAYKK